MKLPCVDLFLLYVSCQLFLFFLIKIVTKTSRLFKDKQLQSTEHKKTKINNNIKCYNS